MGGKTKNRPHKNKPKPVLNRYTSLHAAAARGASSPNLETGPLYYD
jgi:hypothetical protein